MSSHNSNDRFEGIEIKRIRHIQPLGFLSKSARFNVPIDAFYGIIASIAYFMSIREKVDIVHTSGWSWNVFAASLWARINGIPLVRELTSMRDQPMVQSKLKCFIRATLKWADLIVAISPYLQIKCNEFGIGSKVWCRPNPISVRKFFPLPLDEKNKLREAFFNGEISEKDILILHVGRIRPLKNQLFSLKVLNLLPAKYHLAMVGPPYSLDDHYLASIKEYAEKASLKERVHIISENVDNVDEYMNAADILVFPSTSEGLGTVMLEALMCGLPVVANFLPKITDWIIKDGVNGYTTSLDKKEFADKILKTESLIAHRSEIADMASKRFDSNAIDNEYIKRISDLISNAQSKVKKV